MSAVMKKQMELLLEEDERKWNAVCRKTLAYDGQFVFAVSSTGVLLPSLVSFTASTA